MAGIRGINHFGFVVTELDSAIDFLTCFAGFEIVSRGGRPPGMAERLTGVSDADVEIAFVRRGDRLVELLRFHAPDLSDTSPPGPAHTGTAHLALDVADLDAFLRQTEQSGLRLLGEILTIPGGPNKGGKVTYTRHSSGLCIELIES